MTREEKEKYCTDMRDLFTTPGWKWLEATCKSVVARSDDIDVIANEAQLWFAKGEKAQARDLLQLPDDVLELEASMEESDEESPDATY